MLTRQTILGATWTISSRLSGRLIDFVTLLVLARTLTPADFGLTALATTVTVIVDMVLEVPVMQGLIRLQRVGKRHLDTAFTVGLLRGLVLTAVLATVAWPFAHIYGDTRLIPLILLCAIGPTARSLYSPRMVQHIKGMSFRQVFIAELVGKLFAAAVTISALYLGAGYWAIVAATISSQVGSTVMSYTLAPYRPRLSLSELGDFSKFLGWLSGAQLVSALSWQFDRILLGYFATKSLLGQYSMASDLSALPTQSLIGPAMQPVMAAFSQINNNRDRLRGAYSKASRVTMLLAAPMCIGISLTSDLIADVLLGPQWHQAAVFLKWLVLSTLLGAFYQPLQSLALATNRAHVVFRLSLIELCSKIFLMSIGLYFFSIFGVIAARAAASLIVFVLTLQAAHRLVGTNAASELSSLWQAAAASSIMSVLVLGLRHTLARADVSPMLELAAVSSFGAVVYVTVLLGLGVRLKRQLQAT